MSKNDTYGTAPTESRTTNPLLIEMKAKQEQNISLQIA